MAILIASAADEHSSAKPQYQRIRSTRMVR